MFNRHTGGRGHGRGRDRTQSNSRGRGRGGRLGLTTCGSYLCPPKTQEEIHVIHSQFDDPDVPEDHLKTREELKEERSKELTQRKNRSLSPREGVAVNRSAKGHDVEHNRSESRLEADLDGGATVPPCHNHNHNEERPFRSVDDFLPKQNDLVEPFTFENELSRLFGGSKHSLARERRGRRKIGVGDESGAEGYNNDGKEMPPEFKTEGKDKMSVKFYREFCSRLLKEGTSDAIFTHCFLILTWNLMCECGSTTHVCWQHLFWKNPDALEVHFAHNEKEQNKDKAEYTRHIFANPLDPCVCPIFALAIYFSTCFATSPRSKQCKIFPGHQQDKRFSRLFQKYVNKYEDLVKECGHQVEDLETRSIRKGSAFHSSSSPGGPPLAAICERGGWSSRKQTRDTFLQHERGGDQFVGRFLACLPAQSPLFGASPPYFQTEDARAWGRKTIHRVFPMLSGMDNMEKILSMCLSSLVYHKNVMMNMPINHYARHSCVLFCNAQELELDKAFRGTKVVYPWMEGSQKDFAFSGVPPITVVMYHLNKLAEKQKVISDEIVERICEELDKRQMLDGDQLTADRAKEVIAEEFAPLLQLQKQQLQGRAAEPKKAENDGHDGERHQREADANGFHWRFYQGQGRYLAVPPTWRIPNGTALVMWQQWHLGDSTNRIPPFKNLKHKHLNHIDELAETRRPVSKVLSDLRSLMKDLEARVRAANAWTDNHNLDTVTGMYRAIEDQLVVRGDGAMVNGERRDAQLKWQTVLRLLRKKRKQERAQQQGEANVRNVRQKR